MCDVHPLVLYALAHGQLDLLRERAAMDQAEMLVTQLTDNDEDITSFVDNAEAREAIATRFPDLMHVLVEPIGTAILHGNLVEMGRYLATFPDVQTMYKHITSTCARSKTRDSEGILKRSVYQVCQNPTVSMHDMVHVTLERDEITRLSQQLETMYGASVHVSC